MIIARTASAIYGLFSVPKSVGRSSSGPIVSARPPNSAISASNMQRVLEVAMSKLAPRIPRPGRLGSEIFSMGRHCVDVGILLLFLPSRSFTFNITQRYSVVRTVSCARGTFGRDSVLGGKRNAQAQTPLYAKSTLDIAIWTVSHAMFTDYRIRNLGRRGFPDANARVYDKTIVAQRDRATFFRCARFDIMARLPSPRKRIWNCEPDIATKSYFLCRRQRI